YWLETTAAIAALIGLLANRLAFGAPTRSVITEGGLALLVVGSLLVPITGYQAATREALYSLPNGEVHGVHGQQLLAPLVADERGAVLTDEPALAVAAGQPVAYEFVIFHYLTQQGHWDERPIIEAIEGRRFSLVILSIPLEAPPDQ